jgi:adenosylhomocysteine nucleosidase
MQNRIIGIMGAMPEEIDGVKALLSNCRELTMGRRTYFRGTLQGIDTVVVFSRWGKVAAATTVSTLIHRFNITELLFTGVAGAIHPDLRIGDIVVAKRLIYHDLDVRPIIKQFEIPLLNRTYLETDDFRLKTAITAINTLLKNNHLHAAIDEDELGKFNIVNPKLYSGDVASGDQFFYKSSQKHALHSSLPGVLCVEMEGAAVAQVCYEHDIPFTVIRTISDDADENSPVSFSRFIEQVASKYSVEIVKNLYSLLQSPESTSGYL